MKTMSCPKHGVVSGIVRPDRSLRCGKCASAWVVSSRRKKKQKLVGLFGGECQRCGYKKYIGALGGANVAQNLIDGSFGLHGLPLGGGANELHTGFESALDLSTYTSVTGTIYPAGHTHSTPSGPGPA